MAFCDLEGVMFGLGWQIFFTVMFGLRVVAFDQDLRWNFLLSILSLEWAFVLNVAYASGLGELFVILKLLIWMLQLNGKLAVLDSNFLDFLRQSVVSLFQDFILVFEFSNLLQPLSVLFLQSSELVV